MNVHPHMTKRRPVSKTIEPRQHRGFPLPSPLIQNIVESEFAATWKPVAAWMIHTKRRR